MGPLKLSSFILMFPITFQTVSIKRDGEVLSVEQSGSCLLALQAGPPGPERHIAA